MQSHEHAKKYFCYHDHSCFILCNFVYAIENVHFVESVETVEVLHSIVEHI